jgi:hypothetical protein
MIASASIDPTASERVQPKVASACEFHPVITPAVFMVITASSADSTIRRVCSSLARNSSAAFFSSVMSCSVLNQRCVPGAPASPGIGSIT